MELAEESPEEPPEESKEKAQAERSDPHLSGAESPASALLDGEPEYSTLRKVVRRLESASGRPLSVADVLETDPESIRGLPGVGPRYVQYFQELQAFVCSRAGGSLPRRFKLGDRHFQTAFNMIPGRGSAKTIAKMYARILEMTAPGASEDASEGGFEDTPRRAAEAALFFTQGYRTTIEEAAGGALYEEASDGLVTVPNIEFYSLCEHHMLPFFGRCHVGYIPNGRIIGLSKIPRIVEMYARRYQVQERMTRQIAEALQETLNPRGAAVLTEASHLCVMMRGVEKQLPAATSLYALGSLKEDPAARREFLDMLRSNP